jgi:hypothetical protein
MGMEMDGRTTGALLGMIAGDAYVNVRERYQSGKYPYTSSEMRVLHGMQQRAYCEFKCALVNKLLNRNSSVTVVANGPGGRYKAAQFSVSHPYFKVLKGWTYENGSKTFSEIWIKHLTPEGIALWYMDNGHARANPRKDGRITSVRTDIAICRPITQAELVCRWFWDTHRIEFVPVREKKQYYSVRANTENSRLFAKLVGPYMVEPMLYKLAHVADLNSHEPRAPTRACTICSAPIYVKYRTICASCRARRYYKTRRD